MFWIIPFCEKDITYPELIIFILRYLSNYIPLMNPLTKLNKSVLKVLMVIWSLRFQIEERGHLQFLQ